MISALDTETLQNLWWLLASVVGAAFLLMSFVQGGQSLLWQMGKSDEERRLIINALGLKWELSFTSLVVYGGALFAAFPKFYATSFGGAYWVWILILFTFVGQAVSYEFRSKAGNVLGARGYEAFMFLNGTLGILLIGAAVGTFYTGSAFVLSEDNQVTWQHALRGLEAAFDPFNVALGLFLVFLARSLGAMYLVNSLALDEVPALAARLRRAAAINLFIALPFLLFVLARLLFMEGYAVDTAGVVTREAGKYLANLLALPVLPALLVLGLGAVLFGVWCTAQTTRTRGIWFGGLGTFLVGLVVLLLPAYNGTAFYPSSVALGSSLTIHNASSSRYTLVAMTWVALAIPLVLAYIAWIWRQMNGRKVGLADARSKAAY